MSTLHFFCISSAQLRSDAPVVTISSISSTCLPSRSSGRSQRNACDTFSKRSAAFLSVCVFVSFMRRTALHTTGMPFTCAIPRVLVKLQCGKPPHLNADIRAVVILQLIEQTRNRRMRLVMNKRRTALHTHPSPEQAHHTVVIGVLALMRPWQHHVAGGAYNILAQRQTVAAYLTLPWQEEIDKTIQKFHYYAHTPFVQDASRRALPLLHILR